MNRTAGRSVKSMSKADFVTLNDFDRSTIVDILDLASDIKKGRVHRDQARQKILATIFFEPSTRTRLSFESAMLRLGGSVISVADAAATSSSKGESLIDTIRIVSGYADVIALRHPNAGAALVAAQHSSVPIINAGDGGHEHPTQTLIDLFTLREKKGRLDGLTVMLYGDLKNGRTTHSLAPALVAFGARVLMLAEPGLEMPDYVVERCVRAGGVAQKSHAADAVFGHGTRVDMVSPESGVPRSFASGPPSAIPSVDAIYVTRLQKERLDIGDGDRRRSLPPIDHSLLARPEFCNAVVLHPLPRVGEISPTIDDDPRAAFFDQARDGVPVRMALLSMILAEPSRLVASPAADRGNVADESASRCSNSRCIGVVERATVKALVIRDHTGIHRCRFCESRLA